MAGPSSIVIRSTSLLTPSIAENTVLTSPRVVGTVNVVDFDGGSNILSLEGADASFYQLRQINAFSYALELRAGIVLDFETNPRLDVTVRARDAADASNTSNTSNTGVTANFAVDVTNANDAPIITSNGGGDSATIQLAQGVTAVTTVQATDADAGAKLSYRISGGADAALFTINASTGALSFRQAPTGPQSSFNVQVEASDAGSPTPTNGGLLGLFQALQGLFGQLGSRPPALTDTQNLTIVTNITNSPPVNTVPGAQTTAFATALALTGLSVSDADAAGGSLTVTLAVTNGVLNATSVSGGAAITDNGTSTVTLNGTLAAINATLAANPSYTPNNGFAGGDTLTVTSNDNGNTGGATLMDMDTVAITVTPPTTPQTFLPNTGTTFGLSDASTALPIDARFILVGDDEANVLRVYDRAGGVAVKEIGYGSFLGIGNNELDLEGSTQIGNTLYFIGSHGNSRAGADANNREHIFSATLTGTGTDTTLAYSGQFSGLEAALVGWDQSNAHGKGANFFGFAASAAAGSPERNAGLGIEGLTASPDGSALWIGFRAPVTGGAALNKALIVQISNIDAVLAGSTAPVFGTPIELDLGGRGIRSIEKNPAGQYIVIAGPTGNASADVADDFRLYTWDGSSNAGQATNLLQRAVALDALVAGGGSFEAIVQVPDSLTGASYVQLLVDEGGVLVGNTEKKDLPADQQSFTGHFVQLGGTVVDNTAPLLLRSSPVDGASNVASTGSVTLTFSEPVRAGSGNFVLTANGGTPVNIAANAAGVSYEYNTISFSSAALGLLPGTSYTLTAAPGVVLDAVGNAFAGIAAGALDFSTAAAPVAVSLIITEVNSNATGGDFFELFNFGSTAIDLTGFRWDDNSLNPADGGAFSAGTLLAAGARLVVGVDSSTVTGLRSNWNIPIERDVVAIGGPGLGTGDAVALFNASGTLVAAVNYGSAAVTANGNTVPVVVRADGQSVGGTFHAGPAVGGTAGANGVSLVWDGISTTNPAYAAAAVGTNNGYAQPGSAANIGSPGLLPADRAPLLNSNGAGDTAAINYAENGTTAVTTVTATDVNMGDLVGFSITGGADAARFSINPTTGVLTFNASPDFEVPTDDGLNNVYDVIVRATDAIGLFDQQAIAITVTDVNEAPPDPDVTLISAIQGEGDTSPLLAQTVTVQARITAWLPGQNLFFIQEEATDHDDNTLTSEGVAVFYGTGTSPVTADSIGDLVRFTGTVREAFEQTQLDTLSNFTVVTDGTAANLDVPRVVTLPIASGTTLERFEGELITVQSANSGGLLHVADTFTFGRFGETTLYADAVPFQFSEVNAPSVSGNTAYLDFLGRNSIQIDDGSNVQNPSLTALNSGTRILRDTTNDGTTNGTALGADGLGNVNFIRVGDTAESVTGVLGFSFGAYDLTPTQTVNLSANARPPASPAPDVGAGAEVKVASFNVLNYFTTLGTATFTNPSGVVHEGRGASNAVEFTQQEAKIVAAMLATGAHVFGLNELQNNGDAGAIASLVNALNAAAGSNRFAAIGGHANGTDAIRVGIIYDQTVVQPLGLAVTPDTATYSAFAGQNRLPLAQTFGYLNDDSKQFTLVVNHLKSKGGSGTGADGDQSDGAGQFNATRLEAAQQLNSWLNTNPTGATDGDYLLVGDLNSYRREAPVTFLEDAGYTLAANAGDYSYIFDGLRGSLDHILHRGLTSADGSEITGFAHFNINADEQVALDYNDEFGDGSVNVNLDRNDPYRSSDHDPVVIGLRLNSEAGSPTPPPADTLAPALLSSTPVDDAGNVLVGADIVLNFSEAVQLGGSGSIRLVPTAGGSDLVLTASNITIMGSTVTLNPSVDLTPGTAYALRIDADAIEDLAGNGFAGLNDNTALNFRTRVAGPVQDQAVFSENFDSLANSGTTNTTLPTGWFLNETGGGARDNEQYAADTGGSNTGDSYSYGAAGATERALGGLQSGTLIPTIGAVFENTTGQTVVQINVSYTGEQWRLGATGRADRLDFQYSLDATSLTTGSWIDVNALDFVAPVSTGATGALNGNLAANRSSISASIESLALAEGGTLWIRWNSFDATGSDDGLAIDDVQITLVGTSALEPMPVMG